MRSISLLLLILTICSVALGQVTLRGAMFYEIVFTDPNSSSSQKALGLIALWKAYCTQILIGRSNISADQKHFFYGAPMVQTQLDDSQCVKQKLVNFMQGLGTVRQFVIQKNFDAENCVNTGSQWCSNPKCKSIMCNSSITSSTVLAISLVAVGFLAMFF